MHKKVKKECYKPYRASPLKKTRELKQLIIFKFQDKPSFSFNKHMTLD